MMKLLFPLAILVILYWFIGWNGKNSNKHVCNQIGDCSLKCPRCGVFGFYDYYKTSDRSYVICKYCKTMQNDGKEKEDLFMEICPSCIPWYKELEEDETLRHKKGWKMLVIDTAKVKSPLGMLTLKPGHLCKKCEKTNMVKFEPKYDWNKWLKNEIYNFHGYNESKD